VQILQQKEAAGGPQKGPDSEWLGAGSNRRHRPFQGRALPTELPNQKIEVKAGELIRQDEGYLNESVPSIRLFVLVNSTEGDRRV
jgi:hypothetical protein